MGDSLNGFFNKPIPDNKNVPASTGDAKTDGKSPQGLVDANGVKYSPGFTPNSIYPTDDRIGWDGNLPDNHPDSPNYNTDRSRNTSDKFNTDRSIYGLFNDSSQDFFRNGIQTLNGINTDLKSNKDDRHTWDGENVDPQSSQRLSSGFIGTPYENTDPIMFGFEIVIDANSSPLFNGGVEDFISQFGYLKEVGSRSEVIANFKQQFFKFFKSNSPITSTQNDAVDSRFYMSYYLKKVAGLEKLIESNTSETSKSFTDYKKDTIKLTFNEDVSLSVGKMAFLYKLLYWSKINGKNIIPQNLLRFNCDIIISEVRNFNRIKNALSSGGGFGVEVFKDNLSRYVYSLYECQMFFDKMPHDSDISLADAPKIFQDSYDVSFNYKFASTRFENWVPDSKLGQYAVLNNDRMDPFEVKSSETNTMTTGTGSTSTITTHSNYTQPVMYNEYILTERSGSTPPNPGTGDGFTEQENTPTSSTLDKLKSSSKKQSHALSQNLHKAAVNAVQGQINVRVRLLNNTLDKIRNSIGIGRMRAPTNIYKPVKNSTFFYDVHNSLRDFLGNSLGDALGGK